MGKQHIICYYSQLLRSLSVRYRIFIILPGCQNLLPLFLSRIVSLDWDLALLAKAVGDGYVKGSIQGMQQTTKMKKVRKIAQALPDIAVAFPVTMILIEIQDILKSSTAENRTMRRASSIAYSAITLFYLGCGCFANAVFGDKTPGSFFAGFGFYKPYWLIDFANACIVIFLVGGYQVVFQPLYAFVEGWLTETYSSNGFINDFYIFKISLFLSFNFNLLRICFRTALVASATCIAIMFPYFNEVLGVLGTITFCPLVIYFSAKVYIVQKNIKA